MTVSLYQFSNEIKKLIDFKNIKEIDNFMENYKCSGWTALNDAIGTSIDEVGEVFSKMDEKERPEKVLFVIITDGQENASRKYEHQQIKTMISHQMNVYNWNFIYLGANQDAFAVGNSYGFCSNSVMNYSYDNTGIKDMTNAINCYTSCLRTVNINNKNDISLN